MARRLVKVMKQKICVLIYSTSFSEIFLIPRRIEPDIITNVHRPSYTVPVILVRF